MAKKVLLITDSDLDGVSCAIIFKRLASHDVVLDIKHTSANGVRKLIPELIADGTFDLYDKIYFTDLGLHIDDAELLDAKVGSDKLVMIDHHATSLSLPYSWCHVTVETRGTQECATTLLLIHLVNNAYITSDAVLSRFNLATLQSYAFDVRDYDTFAFKRNGNTLALKYNDLLHIYGIDAYKDKFNHINFELTKFDEQMIEKQNKDREIYTKRVIESGMIEKVNIGTEDRPYLIGIYAA